MKKLILLPLLMLMLIGLMVPIAYAQSNPQTGHGAPSGVCLGPYTDIDTGNFYVCKNGQYALAGGSGGGTTTSGNYPVGVIDTTASKYATPIGQILVDCTFTSGQNTISCADGNFTSAMNTWICFGTNQTTDVSILNPTSAVLPEGTFTQTAATTGTCSGGNSTATTTANGVLVIGPLGDTALNSAWTDCIALLSCNYKLPPGPVLVEHPVGIAVPGASQILAAGYGRIQVEGYGMGTSLLVPTPNLSNSATPGCTGGPTGDKKGCFFTFPGAVLRDFGIYGAGQTGLNAAYNGLSAIIVFGQTPVFNANSYPSNLLLLSWGATNAGFTGLKEETNSGEPFIDIVVDGVGSTSCSVAPTGPSMFYFIGMNCTVSSANSIVVNNPGTGGQFASFGSIYGWVAGTTSATAAYVCNLPACYSYGDSIPYTNNQSQQYLSNSGATLFIDGSYMNISSSSFYGTLTNGGTTYIHNTQTTMAAGSGQAHRVLASGTLISEGGNATVSGSGCHNVNLAAASAKFIQYAPDSWGTQCAFVITAGATVGGPATLSGSGTGTITSATTVGLYGLGQYAATTLTSTTTGLGQVMDRAGTIMALVCNAGTAGNQVADACTVVKNHQGTITVTTMSCSLNGVTACSDGTTGHQIAYAQGDVVSVEVIGGTATTLANVTANVVRD